MSKYFTFMYYNANLQNTLLIQSTQSILDIRNEGIPRLCLRPI